MVAKFFCIPVNNLPKGFCVVYYSECLNGPCKFFPFRFENSIDCARCCDFSLLGYHTRKEVVTRRARMSGIVQILLWHISICGLVVAFFLGTPRDKANLKRLSCPPLILKELLIYQSWHFLSEADFTTCKIFERAVHPFFANRLAISFFGLVKAWLILPLCQCPPTYLPTYLPIDHCVSTDHVWNIVAYPMP